MVYKLKESGEKRPTLEYIVRSMEKAVAVAADPIYGSCSQRPSRPQRSHQRTSANVDCPMCQGSVHEVADCRLFSNQRPCDCTWPSRPISASCVCNPGTSQENVPRRQSVKSSCAGECIPLPSKADWEKFRDGSLKRRECRDEQEGGGRPWPSQPISPTRGGTSTTMDQHLGLGSFTEWPRD